MTQNLPFSRFFFLIELIVDHLGYNFLGLCNVIQQETQHLFHDFIVSKQ